MDSSVSVSDILQGLRTDSGSSRDFYDQLLHRRGAPGRTSDAGDARIVSSSSSGALPSDDEGPGHDRASNPGDGEEVAYPPAAAYPGEDLSPGGVPPFAPEEEDLSPLASDAGAAAAHPPPLL